MSVEHGVRAVEAQTWQETLADAETTSAWLTDYLLMDDASAQDFAIPEELPSMVRDRLTALTGARPAGEQFGHTRVAYQGLNEDDHYNAFLFISGYPKRAIALFGDDMSEDSIAGLFVATAHLRQTEEQPRRRIEILPSTGLHPSVRSTGREAVRSARIHDEWDKPASQQRLDLEWQTDALCAQTNPEAFFPDKGGSTRDAKRICASCDVKDECLDYALNNEERFGIWGGKSERERRKLRKDMNLPMADKPKVVAGGEDGVEAA